MRRKLFDSKKNAGIFVTSFLFCVSIILAVWIAYGVFNDEFWIDGDEKTVSAFIQTMQKESSLSEFFITFGTAVACGLILCIFIILNRPRLETICQIVFCLCTSCVMIFAALLLFVFSIAVITCIKDHLPFFQSLGVIGELIFWLVLVDCLPFCIAALICGVIAFLLRKDIGQGTVMCPKATGNQTIRGTGDGFGTGDGSASQGDER